VKSITELTGVDKLDTLDKEETVYITETIYGTKKMLNLETCTTTDIVEEDGYVEDKEILMLEKFVTSELYN